MLRPKICFWYSDILTDLHPHLKEKKAEFWNFYLKCLQILEFQMWIFGRKFNRSAKNFCQNYSSVLYSNQKNFEFNTIVAKVLNLKKPYAPPPPQTRLMGGVSVLLVIPVIIFKTCFKVNAVLGFDIRYDKKTLKELNLPTNILLVQDKLNEWDEWDDFPSWLINYQRCAQTLVGVANSCGVNVIPSNMFKESIEKFLSSQ